MSVPRFASHANCAVAVSAVGALIAIGCASPRSVASSSVASPAAEKTAVLIVEPGADSQARIISFDGVPFDAFVGRHVRPGQFRVPLSPGVHELRVVVPGPCTYYDGRPAPGSSLSNMRFTAREGVAYEVRLDSRPSQLLTSTTVHVYEVVKAPYEFRSVEQSLSNEPDPSSCPDGRGIPR